MEIEFIKEGSGYYFVEGANFNPVKFTGFYRTLKAGWKSFAFYSMSKTWLGRVLF